MRSRPVVRARPCRRASASRATRASNGQFRNDGTLGNRCSVFNFNPYNWYQTPQEKWGGVALANFEINEHAEVYGKLIFSSTQVDQQIAPSGIFSQPYWTPLANPYIGAQAQQSARSISAMRAACRRLRAARAPIRTGVNWRDLNNNGVVDAPDDLLLTYGRRTLELGPRVHQLLERPVADDRWHPWRHRR